MGLAVGHAVFRVGSVKVQSRSETNPATNMKTIARYENSKASHRYEAQVSQTSTVIIDANTRTQAAKLAVQAGWQVWSVNMIG